MILHGVADPSRRCLRRLRGVIGHDVDVERTPLAIEASIGYVFATDDGRDVEELLQHADVAMYVAKVRHIGVAAL